MGNRHSKKLSSSEVEDLLRRCSFSTDDIVALHRQFVREYPTGSIDRRSFMRSYLARFPHADRDFCDRLFRAHDEDDNGQVSFGEFLVSLNVAANGNAEDKLRWAFRMYDIDGDGSISRSEITEILKGIYILRQPSDADAKAEASAKMIMNELDVDEDGELSAREFISAAAKNSVIVDIIDGKAK